MRDFMGHPLQLGDIVIVHEMELHDLFIARIVNLDEQRDTAYAVTLGDATNHAFRYSAKDFVWLSSDYHNVPNQYAYEILRGDRR